MTTLEEITEYAKKCVSGQITSGRKHVWACERFLRDLEKSENDNYPYYWDERAAQNIVDWFALLRHSKGVLAASRLF